MPSPPTNPPVRATLTPVGRTSNTAYSSADQDILIVSPDEGLRDDETSARENIAFQTEYARSVGRPVAVVVLLGGLRSQSADARRIYAEGMNPAHFFASALVVSNPLARAIGSFFLGLTRPATPTALFDTIDKAIEWAKSQRASTDQDS